MDTTGFFQYPRQPPGPLDALPGFLEERGEEDWALLLDHTETRRFRAGQDVLTQGELDRALYLLVDGRLQAPSGGVLPTSTFGEAAFLDGRPRAVTVDATSDAEVLRLSHEAFLSLSARARTWAAPSCSTWAASSLPASIAPATTQRGGRADGHDRVPELHADPLEAEPARPGAGSGR